MVTAAAAAGTLPLLPLLLRSPATAGLARQSSAAAGAAAAAAAVASPRLSPAGGLAFRSAAGQCKSSRLGLLIASTPLGVLGSRSGGGSSSNSGGRGGGGRGSSSSSCASALRVSKTTSVFTKEPAAAASAAAAAEAATGAGGGGGGRGQMAAASEITATGTASASPVADAAAAAAAEVEMAPYGTWRSPLSAAMVSGSSLRFGGMAVDGADRLVWMEGRASEGGRGVVMRETAAAAASTAEEGAEPGPASGAVGMAEEVTPAGMSVKSRVHEYGGGAFGVFGDLLVFSNKSDQRLYRQSLRSSSGGSSTSDTAEEAVPLTPDYGGSALVRYADPSADLQRGLVFCVREDGRADGHGGGDHAEPRNDIVAVRLDPSSSGTPLTDPVSVVSGSDFYAFPRVSPDGRRLAWMQWEHPYMPWDRSTIWVGTLDESGRVVDKECVAGGDDTVIEAPVEPVWSPSGDLYFVTDRGNGFWNIHRWPQSEGKSQVERVVEMDAEFSLPLWVFGTSCFVLHPASPTHIVCFYQRGGVSHLAVIDTQTKAITTLDTMPGLTDMQALASGVNRVFLAAGSPTLPLSIFEVHMAADMRSCTLSGPLWQSSSLASDAPPASGGDGSKQRPLSAYLSQPYWTEFPTGVAGEVAHALVYPPHNPDYVAPEGEAPPLLVKSHGGPTGATSTSLRLPIQYWTSRGWAVADVNYSGSTGYGRAYRERLLGQWGVRDVDDICACVKHLVSLGLADEKRVVTDGSSAGGFTTLAVLTFRDLFRAGCSLYGISDLEALAATTHKFEKHYTDRLVAPPSEVEVYRARSPIYHIDQLNCPVILFQGMEDKVVPPSQAREMYIAVKSKGLPVALIEYEGEDHGFRKAENIEKTIELEMLFFARVVLGRSSVPDINRDLVIDNLPSTST